MAHYMMDCYGIDGVPRESRRIVASSDLEAIREAQKVSVWLKPAFFKVRPVKADRVFYNSKDDLPNV